MNPGLFLLAVQQCKVSERAAKFEFGCVTCRLRREGLDAGLGRTKEGVAFYR